jgi:hypothetical protein
MPMDKNYLSADLNGFSEGNRDLFVRCDHDGKENPDGECWRTRVALPRLPGFALTPERRLSDF